MAGDGVEAEGGAACIGIDDLAVGHQAQLVSAWKPLQMPSIRPSRRSSSSVTPSFSAGLRKKAVMNLAEPSGSSPPEKPPGMKIIWLSPIFRETSSTLRATSSAVRLRMTTISGSAPAASIARAESHSQLVPGNTGISTLGLAVLTAGASVPGLS